MSQEKLDNHLHLPSLSIERFRGIKELSIERLGRVTLLAGKNSVGKTTVLDAVRVYAARGHERVLSKLLESRQEFAIAETEDAHMNRKFVPDFAALFYGRDVSRCARILIGPKSDMGQLRIEETPLDNEQASNIGDRLSFLFVPRGYTQAFKVVFQDTEQVLPWVLPIQGSDAARTVERYGGSAYLYSYSLLVGAEWPSPIGCQPLGPGLLSDKEIVRFWNAIALTDDEDRAMKALRLILDSDLERVAVIRDDVSDISDEKSNVGYVQRVVAKLRGQARPVPLQSLGDGALHLAGTALALANSRDGFLLIDEAENGIHHSMQPDFWRMIFKTADANNVQVIATTHSFDCVRGFAQAAVECEEVEGVLVRLERKDEEMWAVEYSESDLRIAAEQRIEVR